MPAKRKPTSTIHFELRAWRARRFMSRDDAAECLGISVRTLENLENGNTTRHWRTMLTVMRLHDTCEDLKRKVARMERAPV